MADFDYTDLDEGYSYEKPTPFVKGRRGGKSGNKGNKRGGTSVLRGDAPRGREHLCWGTKCESDATRLAGIPTKNSAEPIAFVPLCQSCAGKVKRRAEKRNLPEPRIGKMGTNESELYKLQVDSPPAEMKSEGDFNKPVEDLIKSKRAGTDLIYSMGEGKSRVQSPGGKWKKGSQDFSGNPKGRADVKNIARERQYRNKARNLMFRMSTEGSGTKPL